MTELETWYQTDNGRYLLELIKEQLAEPLDTAFGYHLAQVAVTRMHPLYDASRVRNRVYVAAQSGAAVTLQAESDQLPLASDSVDVIIAHHNLEFSDNPHQALRELHRALTPHGHLFIIAFNPWSLTGLNAALRARMGHRLWRQRQPLSTGRLSDWLNVLGFEPQQTLQCYALPPFGGQGMRASIKSVNKWCASRGLPIGGLFMMHAIKQVPACINRPILRSRRGRLIGLAVPQSVSSPRASATARKGDDTA